MKTTVEIMQAASETFAERAKVYGEEGYRSHSKLVSSLFPEGITLKTEDEFTRFWLFNMLIVKLTRYATNYAKGGHQDSVHDLGVYAFILESFDTRMADKEAGR